MRTGLGSVGGRFGQPGVNRQANRVGQFQRGVNPLLMFCRNWSGARRAVVVARVAKLTGRQTARHLTDRVYALFECCAQAANIAVQPRVARDRFFAFARTFRARLDRCNGALLDRAWLTKGYFSGCSIDSTARSTSRSGQYK